MKLRGSNRQELQSVSEAPKLESSGASERQRSSEVRVVRSFRASAKQELQSFTSSANQQGRPLDLCFQASDVCPHGSPRYDFAPRLLTDNHAARHRLPSTSTVNSDRFETLAFNPGSKKYFSSNTELKPQIVSLVKRVCQQSQLSPLRSREGICHYENAPKDQA